MCVTVLFGDSREELFNPDCKLIDFIHDLKRRCGLDPEDRVDLMSSRGAVVKLEGREFSLDRASALLKNRSKYILVRVCREADGGCKLVPLLTKTSHSEFKELLKRLKGRNPGPAKTRNKSKNCDTF